MFIRLGSKLSIIYELSEDLELRIPYIDAKLEF
jgi:hypothetical protein